MERRISENRDRIDAIEESNRKRWNAVVALLVLLFCVQLAIGGLSYHLRGENTKRIADIQGSRKEAIRSSCLQQNVRNARAYLFLRALPPTPNQPQRSPAEKKKLLHGFTDALVGPVRDCDRLVHELVR